MQTPESCKKINTSSTIVSNDKRSKKWRFENLPPFTNLDGTPDLRFKHDTKVSASNWKIGRDVEKNNNNDFSVTDDDEESK